MGGATLPLLLLALLLLAQPLAPRVLEPLLALHAVAAALLLVLAAPVLWRTPRVRAGWPALAAAAALASLAMALLLQPAEAPRVDSRWAALTGALHASTFLVALFLFPGPEAEAARVRRTALLLAGLLAAAAGLQVVLSLARAPDDPGDTRLAGTLGNPNAFGAFISAAGLVVLGTGWALRRQALAAGRAGAAWRPLLVALLLAAPLAWALLASRSRGAMAATLATLLLLALRWRQRLLLATALASAVALVVVPNPLRDRLLHLQPDHVFTRPFLWSVAAEVAGEHPAGLGPTLFRHEFPKHALDPERPWLLHQRHEVGLAHNVFLTLATEWGWLACAAALALAGWALARQATSCGGRLDPLRLSATLGAAVLFFELQVDGLEQNPLVFTTFLVLAAAALARLPAGRGVLLPGRALALLALAAGLAAGAAAVGRAQGPTLVRQAEALAAALPAGGDVAPVRTAFDTAVAALPGELPPARSRLAFELSLLRARPVADGLDAATLKLAGHALAAAEEAVACDGLDAEVRWQSATVSLLLYRRGKRPEDLQRYLSEASEALDLDPLDVAGHFDLAQEALRVDLRAFCARRLERVLELEPDHAFAWFVRARLLELEGDLEAALHAWVRADEAVLNAHRKAAVESPRSRLFFEDIVKRTDLAQVRARIVTLRRELYF